MLYHPPGDGSSSAAAEGSPSRGMSVRLDTRALSPELATLGSTRVKYRVIFLRSSLSRDPANGNSIFILLNQHRFEAAVSPRVSPRGTLRIGCPGPGRLPGLRGQQRSRPGQCERAGAAKDRSAYGLGP